MTPRTKASVDVVGAGGVAVAAGADVVALVSGTCTAVDFWLLGTLGKASIVDLPFLSSTSS